MLWSLQELWFFHRRSESHQHYQGEDEFSPILELQLVQGIHDGSFSRDSVETHDWHRRDAVTVQRNPESARGSEVELEEAWENLPKTSFEVRLACKKPGLGWPGAESDGAEWQIPGKSHQVLGLEAVKYEKHQLGLGAALVCRGELAVWLEKVEESDGAEQRRGQGKLHFVDICDLRLLFGVQKMQKDHFENAYTKWD